MHVLHAFTVFPTMEMNIIDFLKNCVSMRAVGF